MASLDDIVTGLAVRLRTISGLNVTEYFRGTFTPPVAVIGVPAVPEYHIAMGRNPRYSAEPQIHLFTSSAADTDGQRTLAKYANPFGPYSIRAAIEGDRTLGGAVEDCIVREFRPLNLEEYTALNYFGGVFTLQVTAKG